MLNYQRVSQFQTNPNIPIILLDISPHNISNNSMDSMGFTTHHMLGKISPIQDIPIGIPVKKSHC